MLLSITVKNFYEPDLPPLSAHVFEAPTPGEHRRWCKRTKASSMADALMHTAQPSNAAAQQILAAHKAAAAEAKIKAQISAELTRRAVAASSVAPPLHMKMRPPPPPSAGLFEDTSSAPWEAGATLTKAAAAAAALAMTSAQEGDTEQVRQMRWLAKQELGEFEQPL